MVMLEIRAEVEEQCHSMAVAMRQQGASTRWDSASTRKISWSELWKSETARLKFLIQAEYDVLPGPSNLHSWGLAERPLCQAIGTLEHVLS